jgi:hypothetical protein
MHIQEHIRKHIVYYLAFFSIQIVGWMLFLLVSPDRAVQMIVTILVTFFSTAFALVHHKASHTLNSKIVVEYVLIAALGIGLMLIYLK